MPVLLLTHVKFIDDLLDIEDISREILHHIDVEEMDRREKREKKQRKKWKKNADGNDQATHMIVTSFVG